MFQQCYCLYLPSLKEFTFIWGNAASFITSRTVYTSPRLHGLKFLTIITAWCSWWLHCQRQNLLRSATQILKSIHNDKKRRSAVTVLASAFPISISSYVKSLFFCFQYSAFFHRHVYHTKETAHSTLPVDTKYHQHTDRRGIELSTYITWVLISPLPDQEGNKLQRKEILSYIYPIYNHNWRNTELFISPWNILKIRNK